MLLRNGLIGAQGVIREVRSPGLLSCSTRRGRTRQAMTQSGGASSTS